MAVVGTVGVFMEESGQGPVNAVFFRCVFGALVLLAFCAARGWLGDLRLAPRQWALILFGGICIVLNWVAFFAAIRHTSIAFATIVYHVQPFGVVLAGAVLFRRAGERPEAGLDRHRLRRAGAWPPASASGATEPGRLLGAGLAVLASLLYTGTVLSTKALRGVRAAPDRDDPCRNRDHPAGALRRRSRGLPAAPGPWGWLAGLGIVHTGLVYVLMYAAYPKLPTPGDRGAGLRLPGLGDPRWTGWSMAISSGWARPPGWG